MIIRVSVVLRRTVWGDFDWRFDNLSGSHLQSQVNCGTKRTNHFLQSSQPITSRLIDKRPITSWLRWPIKLTTRDIYTTHWRSTIHLTLKMTSAQVVETSVKVTSNSPSQDYTHRDDHNLPTYEKIHCCAVYNYSGKADLGKGYWNPKRKLGVITHFQR